MLAARIFVRSGMLASITSTSSLRRATIVPAVRSSTLVIAGVTAIVLTASAASVPYLPGDVLLTRVIQSGLRPGVWAVAMTQLANAPWRYLLVVLGGVAGWRLAGWRGAVMVVAVALFLPPFGDWLKPIVARPRPSPSLVTVTGPVSGYSYPSTAGLVYGAVFGSLALLAIGGRRRWFIAGSCVGVLVAAGAARVSLGAHWPSDIAGAYLIALVFAGSVQWAVRGR